MADVSVGETAWDTTTSPKTVTVADAADGDILLVQIHGNKSGTSNAVTACTTTNTAGTVSWQAEPGENFTAADTSSTWYSSARGNVTATASVTISVSRTQSGTANRWGFIAYRLRGYSGIGNVATSTNTATDSQSLTVSAADSFVAYLGGDWDALLPTAWTPSGQTEVERAVWGVGIYSIAGAYWISQATGTRSYGTTDNPGTGTVITQQAIEMLIATVAAPPLALLVDPARSIPRRIWR